MRIAEAHDKCAKRLPCTTNLDKKQQIAVLPTLFHFTIKMSLRLRAKKRCYTYLLA